MTRDEAIEQAMQIAQAQGWPWIGSVVADRVRRWFVGGAEWRVRSNSDCRGMNVVVILDDRTGEIRHKAYLSR